MAYSESEKKGHLLELARRGGRVREYESESGISRTSLIKWKKDYSDFYLRAAAESAADIEEQTVTELRERLNAANDLEAEVLRQLEESIRNNPPSKALELSTILQRVAIVKGINADKLLKLTGRPAHLPQSNVHDLLEKLTRRGIIVDAVAVEEQPLAIPPLSIDSAIER